ncbi:MAG: HAD-IIB family hydrolase [Treponema sp.]|nr:HAD-IIB family hydrolase [Treponema sp.]
MKPIQEMTSLEARNIRFVLVDIDDTLTQHGKLLPSSYKALWNLKAAGLKVIPVTGRPAGWCDLIAREWPVDGVIGENGALALWEEPQPQGGLPRLKAEYHPEAVRNDHPTLKRIQDRAFQEMPELRLAKDQFARLFDIAIDFAEEEPVLSLEDAQRVQSIAIEEGAVAKVSSIHINIWMGTYNKLSMTERFLIRRFNWIPGIGDKEALFIGDSPNDEPMFVRFPLTCAVANIRRYESLIQHFPMFVASKECGGGFAEIAETILAKR